ncbi:hypothetical protein [Propionibacterium freudenreichii]|uniref:hypothetical protein n=1 Tax=Propionibacterium freudenreichii TaxID=1744 RepID=UPI0021A83029|nr:hypothetical protein [Propionibacterium freudenreichii]
MGGAHHLVVAPALPVEGVGVASAGQEQLAGVARGLAASQPAAHAQQRGAGAAPVGGLVLLMLVRGLLVRVVLALAGGHW